MCRDFGKGACLNHVYSFHNVYCTVAVNANKSIVERIYNKHYIVGGLVRENMVLGELGKSQRFFRLYNEK